MVLAPPGLWTRIPRSASAWMALVVASVALKSDMNGSVDSQEVVMAKAAVSADEGTRCKDQRFIPLIPRHETKKERFKRFIQRENSGTSSA